MDPISTRALEPLLPALRPPAASPTSAAPATETDAVTLSPAARAAAAATVAPVEATEEDSAAEDALHQDEDATEAAEGEAANEDDPQALSPEEQTHVSKLRARDLEVRAHEAAHIGASGGLAGGASFTYQEGPDGRRYAIGGEVPISAPASSDPQQALMNAERMRAAALAPAAPTGQDRAVAARASAIAAQARAALAEEARPPAADEAQETTPAPTKDGEASGGDDSGEAATSGYDQAPEPARMGGPSFSGPAMHLHSDGC